MSDLKQIETTSNTIKNPAKRDFFSKTSPFCSSLSRKGGSYRPIIQLVVLSTVFSVITIIGITKNISSNAIFAAYMICSLLFVFINHFIFGRTASLYRKAYILDLVSDHPGALSILEKIGPKSRRPFKVPLFAYHRLKAQILAHSGQFSLAEAEIYRAQEEGLSAEELAQTRTKFFESLGDYSKARQEISKALDLFQNSLSLRINQVLLLTQAREYRVATKVIKEISENIDCRVFQRNNYKLILNSLLGICELWTGHAEEGIESLLVDLEELYLYSINQEAIRPLASWCFLERAYYYATHQNHELALIDVKTAQKLCLYPEHQQKVTEIKDELKLRHNI